MFRKNKEIKNDGTKEEFSCKDMLDQLMGQEMNGCACGEMMSQNSPGKDLSTDMKMFMSQMESCCGFMKDEESVSK